MNQTIEEMKRMAEFKLDGANIDCRVLAKNNLRLIEALKQCWKNRNGYAKLLLDEDVAVRQLAALDKELEQILSGDGK